MTPVTSGCPDLEGLSQTLTRPFISNNLASSGPLSSDNVLLDGQVPSGQSLTLNTLSSSVTYDLGKNIAGWINFKTTSGGGSVSSICETRFSHSHRVPQLTQVLSSYRSVRNCGPFSWWWHR